MNKPAQVLLQKLSSKLSGDFTYQSGRILGSMCTLPHPIGSKTFTTFIDKNLGDPNLFPNTSRIEKEVVEMIGSLLSNRDACGWIVSGGSEANITALWVARNSANKHKPEVILPKTAHFSFKKALDMLQITPVYIDVNEDYRIKVEDVGKAINESTVAIVGVAGSSGLGVVDPISELSEIALQHKIHLHVDAAFGGFIIPFLKEMGYSIPDFDFRLEGVKSLTVDPHKMGLAPIPSGGILFRDESIFSGMCVKADGGTSNPVLLGTRSGASACAVWAVLKYLGHNGYRKIIGRCIILTQKLVDGIKKINGIQLVTEPTLNIVGIKSDSIDIKLIDKELRKKGWATSLFSNYMRIIVMPHTTSVTLNLFLKDLMEVSEKLCA
ncbi:MAG: tyrosine decarboxylase MfnA [Candidatus Bathyarchaeota archaeon]